MRYVFCILLITCLGCSLKHGNLYKDVKYQFDKSIEGPAFEVRKRVVEKRIKVHVTESQEVQEVLKVLCAGIHYGYIGNVVGQASFELNERLTKTEIMNLIDALTSSVGYTYRRSGRNLIFMKSSGNKMNCYTVKRNRDVDINTSAYQSAQVSVLEVGETLIVKTDDYASFEVFRDSIESARKLESYKLSYTIYEVNEEHITDDEISVLFGNQVKLSGGSFANSLYSLSMNLSNNVKAQLNLLESMGYLESYTSPSVFVLEGVEGKVKLGQSVPVIVQQSQQQTSTSILNSVVYRDVGLVLTSKVEYLDDRRSKIFITVDNSSLSQKGVLDNPTFQQDSFSSSRVIYKHDKILIGGKARLAKQYRSNLKFMNVLGRNIIENRDRNILILVEIEKVKV